jgi:hypothetical protein
MVVVCRSVGDGRSMKKWSIVGGVIGLVLCLAWALRPVLAWNGGATVQFRFHVVESGGARPVKGARIRIIRESELQSLFDTNGAAGMPPAHTTDANGSAAVSVMCGAGGSQGWLGKTGHFIIAHELLVEADGYRPLSTALANVVGGQRWPLSKRVFDIELVLFRKP